MIRRRRQAVDVPVCSACGAEVLLAHDSAGRPIMLDLMPDPTGDRYLARRSGLAGVVALRVGPGDAIPVDEVLYRAHVDTCRPRLSAVGAG